MTLINVRYEKANLLLIVVWFQSDVRQKRFVVWLSCQEFSNREFRITRIAGLQNTRAVFFAKRKIKRIAFEFRKHVARKYFRKQITIILSSITSHQMTEICNWISLRRSNRCRFCPKLFLKMNYFFRSKKK